MGYDTGLNTDLTCPFAPCLLYVHTATCKPYKHQLSSTNCYSIWYYLEYMFLLPPTKETQCGISSNLCLFIYIVLRTLSSHLFFKIQMYIIMAKEETYDEETTIMLSFAIISSRL